MITTLEIENIMYLYLKDSSLADEITGKVYKRSRPAQSKQEDVVINCLPVNNTQLQFAVVNVNIHVPNIRVLSNNIEDGGHVDHPRMLELSGIAKDLLDDQWSSGYSFHVQQQNIFQDEISENAYVNFRIDFNYINI
jgi:hypothetical protein